MKNKPKQLGISTLLFDLLLNDYPLKSDVNQCSQEPPAFPERGYLTDLQMTRCIFENFSSQDILKVLFFSSVATPCSGGKKTQKKPHFITVQKFLLEAVHQDDQF